MTLVEAFGNVFLRGLGPETLKEFTDLLKAADKEIAELREDNEFLYALEDAGVDNWSGYEEARKSMHGDD